MSSVLRFSFSNVKPHKLNMSVRTKTSQESPAAKTSGPGSELTERDTTHQWVKDEKKAGTLHGRFSVSLKQAIDQFHNKVPHGSSHVKRLQNAKNPLIGMEIGYNFKEESLCNGAIGDDIVPLGPLVFHNRLLPDLPKPTYKNYVQRWVDLMDKIAEEVNGNPVAKARAGKLVLMLNKEVERLNSTTFVDIRAIEFVYNDGSVTVKKGTDLTEIQSQRIRAVIAWTDMFLESVASTAEKFFEDLEALEILEEKIKSTEEDRVDLLLTSESSSSGEEEESSSEEEVVQNPRPASATAKFTPHPPDAPRALTATPSTPPGEAGTSGYIKPADLDAGESSTPCSVGVDA